MEDHSATLGECQIFNHVFSFGASDNHLVFPSWYDMSDGPLAKTKVCSPRSAVKPPYEISWPRNNEFGIRLHPPSHIFLCSAKRSSGGGGVLYNFSYDAETVDIA